MIPIATLYRKNGDQLDVVLRYVTVVEHAGDGTFKVSMTSSAEPKFVLDSEEVGPLLEAIAPEIPGPRPTPAPGGRPAIHREPAGEFIHLHAAGGELWARASAIVLVEQLPEGYALTLESSRTLRLSDAEAGPLWHLGRWPAPPPRAGADGRG